MVNWDNSCSNGQEIPEGCFTNGEWTLLVQLATLENRF